MTCPSCNHENRPGAKFCEECAVPLKRACANCGAELRPTAKFCDECAAPSGASPRPAGPSRATFAEPADTRKVVTIVFADLVGSTALHERLDPESARRFMESYYAAMRGAVEAQGGKVTQLLGDGVKAVFGIPRVAEDDAICAVRAAVAMQESFRALAEQQHGAVGKTGLRVAVNTGEVVAKDETEIIGDPVNVAARLQEQGKDGDVVVGESTYRLVSSLVTLELLGSFALKGRSEAVKAYRIVSLDRPAGAATARFVGRAEELARLAAVYGAAVAKPAAGLAVLLGSPGLGKSRLIDEFARRHADAATVVQAHCDAAGGATFAPLARALRELLGIDDGAGPESLRAAVEGAFAGDDADRGRIAGGIAALLAGSPASPEETFFVVRRMLGALAQTRPVVLVIDDLHWAEPLLLDLVEHLIQWGSGVPLLVLIGARPELRDLRSSLVTPGGLVADVVTLAGLDAGAAMRLAANVIGAADLPAVIAAKVLATSEGNPLFVGELVRMLVQEGALTREGDRWTVGANLASLEMPPTIHALLAARIERLRPEERAVLERAAVVGRHFSRSAVAALLPREASDLDARLEALRRSELIERDTGWLLGEPVLRFHHVLIRDAAYRRLLKGTRAELHARLAEWIEAQVGDVPDHDETIGRHLEQAHQFLHELGPLDESGQRLGERAALRLSAAGRRALGRDDLPVAAGLLGRAIARLDAADPARAGLALDWCEALLSAGDVGPASAALAELGRFSADSDRLLAWQTCFESQLTVLTAPQGLQAAADEAAKAARQLAAHGDAAGEAKAHSVHAQALARLGKVAACESALDLALAAARRAGDRRRANAVLAGAPLAALWGPSPVTRASGRCLDVVRVLRITQGAPAVEAVALSCQGVLEALRGRIDAARRMLASSREMVEELGIASRLFEADAFAGRIEAMEGDTAAAERLLRGAYEGLRDLGLRIDAARAGALLARVLLAQDRVAEAEALSHESERLSGDDLQAAIAWRGVRAEALAKRGEHASAIELAKAAVAIASATDALLDHADARMALTAALRAAGHDAEADAEERRAIELWEAKGATLLADRARRPAAQPAAAIAEPAASRVSLRRVRPNVATASFARLDAALVARDIGAIEAIHSEAYQEKDHATGATCGRDDAVDLLRRFLGARDPRYRHEVLATLGDSLILARRWHSTSGSSGGALDVGEYERESITLGEVDTDARIYRAGVFTSECFSEAIVRLYERYAERQREGAERERAVATARALGAILLLLTIDDPERVAEAFGPDFESVDHRHLSTWSMRGSDAWLTHVHALRQVATDIVMAVEEVIGLEPGALLLRRMHSGTERLGGGSYERPFLLLLSAGADGRIVRLEWFDADREGEALARFESLVGRDAELPAKTFANAAWRGVERVGRCWEARDWKGVLAELSPAMRMDDRRRIMRLEIGYHDFVAQFRMLFDQPSSRWYETLYATRGERLSLARTRFEAEVTDGGGPLAFDDHLSLTEVDADGRCIASVIFDLDDEDAAYAELDARFAVDRGAPCARALLGLLDAIAVRDWDALVALCSPAFIEHDHRSVALPGATRGAGAWVRKISTLVELAPDATPRFEHVKEGERSALWTIRWHGTREVSGYEIPMCGVIEIDAQGRIAGANIYGSEQLAEALARFAALVGGGEVGPAPGPFENAAARADRLLFDCFNGRDWAGIEALADPKLVFDERRRMLRNTCGREVWLEQFRLLFDVPASHFTTKLLATRGERLALNLHCFEGEVAGGGGPLAIGDHLVLHEVDHGGRIIAIVLFDLEDKDAAYAELDARWGACEGPEHQTKLAFLRDFGVALARRDWDAVAAAYAPAFVGEDHRLVSWGTLHGPVAFVEVFRAMADLAPDACLCWEHLRVAGGGMLAESVWLGTRDGGVFESPLLMVMEFDASGIGLRADFYDTHHFDRASARFAEVRAGARSDPLAAIAKPNAASAAMDRWHAAFDVACDCGDWEPMRATCAPGLVFDDRRRMSLLYGDRELMIASARERVATGARPRRSLLGAAGDRIVIGKILWSGGPVGGRFEIEYVCVAESDSSGVLTAFVFFDTDDAEAAKREAWRRWVALEPELAATVACFLEAPAGFHARDRARVRALYADDLVVEDHRRTGVGRIEGGEAYADSIKVLWELASDARIEFGWFWPAVDRNGALLTLRRTGDVAGGGPFESDYLYLALHADGRITYVEIFELEDLDAALLRFEALRRPG